MTAPSTADLAAAARILGHPVEVRTGAVIREWKIEYERPQSAKTYFVEERPDTKFGGSYFYCNCAGWRFQKGKGLDCKHVAFIKCALGSDPCMDNHDGMMASTIPAGDRR